MSQADDTGEEAWGCSGQDEPQCGPRTGTPRIAAYESDGSHAVFTEPGNSDAWIATDHVVDVRK
ncbi:hypothetical protein ACFR9U_00365 [Halorientalis brevis]|uniref:Uncharacterized protein n=1 Tax=Halorientalis brevis TaxID=1126241 RepID=A0ABD6C554_9EURY|nr:hypothetical protein [Halorientalis brevis]